MSQPSLSHRLLPLLLALACSGGFKGGDTADSAGGGGGGGEGGEEGSDGSSVGDGGDDASDGGDGGTDPAPETYEGGGWTKGTCADDIDGSGTGVGDVAADFSLIDQFGEDVRLYDFCDRAVLIVFGAMWDGASLSMATELEDTYQEYGERGFIVLHILFENAEASAPTEEDLAGWVGDYDSTHPVLSDPGGDTYWTYGEGWIPYSVLLRPGLVIESLGDDVSDADIESVLPQ